MFNNKIYNINNNFLESVHFTTIEKELEHNSLKFN